MPRGFDFKAIRAATAEIVAVNPDHDRHVWSVAGDNASLTAHVAIGGGGDTEPVRREMTDLLLAHFAIHHVILQIKFVPCDDETALHR